MSRRLLGAAALCVLMAVEPAHAASLTVTQNSDVTAGMAAFGASTPLITWSNLYAPGTSWATGVWPGPTAAFGTQTATDPATGTVVNSPPNGLPNGINNLFVANWIDGPGFNLSGGVAGPDLALDGEENFKLTFTSGVTKIGFAVSTGQGNLTGQFDHLGAVFQLTTNNGDLGSLTLLDPGIGLVAWVTVQSATPFTSLTFFEPSGNNQDQYFGNFVSAPAPVPLPPSIVSQLIGFGVLGLLVWRRKRKIEVPRVDQIGVAAAW